MFHTANSINGSVTQAKTLVLGFSFSFPLLVQLHLHDPILILIQKFVVFSVLGANLQRGRFHEMGQLKIALGWHPRIRQVNGLRLHGSTNIK